MEARKLIGMEQVNRQGKEDQSGKDKDITLGMSCSYMLLSFYTLSTNLTTCDGNSIGCCWQEWDGACEALTHKEDPWISKNLALETLRGQYDEPVEDRLYPIVCLV